MPEAIVLRYFESDLAGQLVLVGLDPCEGPLEVSYIVHCRGADPAVPIHPHQEAGGRVVAAALAALAPADEFEVALAHAFLSISVSAGADLARNARLSISCSKLLLRSSVRSSR